jgi:hypothetical protein
MKKYYITFLLENGQHGIRVNARNEKSAINKAVKRINEILINYSLITEDDICDIDLE